MKICKAKAEFVEFMFEREIEGNGSDCNVRLGSPLNNQEKILKFLGISVRENGGYVECIFNRINYGWMNW